MPPRQMRIQSIRFSEATWNHIRERAAAHGISASQYIREAALVRVAYEVAREDAQRGEDFERLSELVRQLTLGLQLEEEPEHDEPKPGDGRRV